MDGRSGQLEADRNKSRSPRLSHALRRCSRSHLVGSVPPALRAVGLCVDQWRVDLRHLFEFWPRAETTSEVQRAFWQPRQDTDENKTHQHPPPHRANKCHYSQQHHRQAQNQDSRTNTDTTTHVKKANPRRSRQHNRTTAGRRNAELTKKHIQHHTQRHDTLNSTKTLMTADNDAPPPTERIEPE